MNWLRRIAKGLGVVVVLLVLAAGYTYFRAEAHITGFKPKHGFTTPIPTDVASIARGWHLAKTRGCTGCHGAELQGQHMDPQLPWFLVRLVAPNISKLAKTASPAQLEAAIRQGIRHDNRAMIVMPSSMFSHLSDEDTADIIAMLKANPVQDTKLPRPYIGPLAYYGLVWGEFQNQTAPDLVRQQPDLQYQAADADPVLKLGEYAAMTSCTECHGQDLHGQRPWTPGQPPDLGGARGYSREDFGKLMRTGVPPGGRELNPLMAMSAKFRFANFSDEEVDAIYAYLNSFQPTPE